MLRITFEPHLATLQDVPQWITQDRTILEQMHGLNRSDVWETYHNLFPKPNYQQFLTHRVKLNISSCVDPKTFCNEDYKPFRSEYIFKHHKPYQNLANEYMPWTEDQVSTIIHESKMDLPPLPFCTLPTFYPMRYTFRDFGMQLMRKIIVEDCASNPLVSAFENCKITSFFAFEK